MLNYLESILLTSILICNFLLLKKYNDIILRILQLEEKIIIKNDTTKDIHGDLSRRLFDIQQNRYGKIFTRFSNGE